MKDLLKKIEEKQITVGVIGLGYVGLPLAVEYARKGIKTIGFDVDEKKIEKLNKGVNYIEDIDDKWVEETTASGLLRVVGDFSLCADCDVIYICVPTPFTDNKDPDISYILDASESVAAALRDGQVIILKSTTFPGTTEKCVRPTLERNGKKAGRDFYLAFSPERIDPGNKTWNTSNTPIVVGGVDDNSTALACAAHKLIVDIIVPVNSPATAEMEKLLENIFRSVNIALVNELAQLCDRVGINVWDVVDAASTKPFGFMPFYPGPGIGGHCILIDPYYLAWMAREYDFVTKFISLAGETNEDMPYYVRNMVVKEIARLPITMENAKILLLGMAFKRDVSDLRHSPALKVAELLVADGMKNISYYDPYIPEININGGKIASDKELTPESLKKFDLVVITTDHSVFDFQMIADAGAVVIDTRNACRNVKGADNIVLLGDGK